MYAKQIDIAWHSGLSVFSSDFFLRSVGDEFGWIGGFDESGTLRCILPYTIVKKSLFRMVRFRVETIFLENELTIQEEQTFLNSAIDFFRSIRADVIIPATTNTIFRTYPDRALAAPYGSYVVDLDASEDVLWRNIDRITRQNINTAKKKNVYIFIGNEYLDQTYSLIFETFKRSRLPFMKYRVFKRYVVGLGDNAKIFVAMHNDSIQSCVVYAFSKAKAYAVYGGNVLRQQKGSNKLLHWEAILHFKNHGVQLYDFVGARIDPPKGSKQNGINKFKQRLGGRLKKGYMWKYSIRPFGALAYNMGVRFLRGGDIVDIEQHKLKNE